MYKYHPKPYIHKHLHYHYHIDGEGQSCEGTPKHSRVTALSGRHSGQFDEDNQNWKTYINPEVTALYEQISLNGSFSGNENPEQPLNCNKQTSASKRNLIKPFQGVNQYEHESPSLKGRQKLERDIKVYEDYLRQRSQTNLFVPGSRSMIDLGTGNSRNISSTQLESNPELGNQRKLSSLGYKKAESRDGRSKLMETTHTREETNNLDENESIKHSLSNLTTVEFNNNQQTQSAVDLERPAEPTHSSMILTKPKQETQGSPGRRKSKFEKVEPPTEQQVHRKSENQRDALRMSGRTSKVTEMGHSGSEVKSEQTVGANHGEEVHEMGNTPKVKYFLHTHRSSQDILYSWKLVEEECRFLRKNYLQHHQKLEGAKANLKS